MNTNQHQSAHNTHPQERTGERRSATPSPVDTSGQRQRTRQYINAHHDEINKIRKENPQSVQHKSYANSYQNKRRRNALVTLVLVVFLCFSLSLLAVYGIASMVKEKNTPKDTTQQDTVATDTISSDSQSNEITDTTAPTTESAPVYAQPDDSTKNLGANVLSSNAILISLDTHTITAQKAADVRIYPASMTKIMTLLVAAENITSLTDKATVSKDTTNYCYLEGATVAGFSPNETVTMEDLLYGIILPSGADATMTIADHIAGSEEEFVMLMNLKAEELGLRSTHFVNSSGLHHPEHYSTVHDIALILKAAIDNDICFKVLTAPYYITSITEQHPQGIELFSRTHTRISSIKINDLEIVGGKTGYTPEAGQCLATYAITSDGREYIFVSANAPDKNQTAKDAEYAYKTFTSISDDEDTTQAA